MSVPVAHDPTEAQPPRCAVLQGGAEERDAFRTWRRSALDVIDPEGPAIDIIHHVATWRAPRVLKTRGVELLGTVLTPPDTICELDVSASDDACAVEQVRSAPEWWARVEVDTGLFPECGTDPVWLRADDALGAFGHVLYVGSRGVLLLHEEELVWVAAPDRPQPAFRMTWRSDFVISLDSGPGTSTRATSSPGSKGKPLQKRTAAPKAASRKTPKRK